MLWELVQYTICSPWENFFWKPMCLWYITKSNFLLFQKRRGKKSELELELLAFLCKYTTFTSSKLRYLDSWNLWLSSHHCHLCLCRRTNYTYFIIWFHTLTSQLMMIKYIVFVALNFSNLVILFNSQCKRRLILLMRNWNGNHILEINRVTTSLILIMLLLKAYQSRNVSNVVKLLIKLQ